MNLKFKSALLVGKANDLAVSIIDKSRGTIRAGSKALAIDPDFVRHLKGIDPEKVLFITGTNGKSTVNNIINHILKTCGYKVVSNVEGANLQFGITTALVRGADFSGNVNADFYIFETDERYLYSIRQQLPGAWLLVTNLQKDQVQRNGDPDFIYRKIAAVIDDFGMKLFLNGDEPRSCSLADRGRSAVYFGVERHSSSFTKGWSFVTMPCPKCRHKIVFDYFNNDGMGGFRCANCGFRSADSEYRITDVDFAGKTFRMGGAIFPMPYEQPFMLYNYAAAVAVCKELAGITEEECARALESYTLLGGRIDSIEYKGKHIKYMRFKQENPETLQNFINTVAEDPEEKVLVIGFGTINDFQPNYINSFYAYDCDLSALIKSNVSRYIFVTDTVCYDAANSFKYGGVDPDKIEVIPTNDIEVILDAISRADSDNIYLTIELHRFEHMKEFAKKEAHV